MNKEVEELIKIVGKGNLLEALFIFLGGYQNTYSMRTVDHRNHLRLFGFIKKKEEKKLDKYFNLMFSLQGLFLIYSIAYKCLKENELSTQGVIDEIYKSVYSNEKLKEQLDCIIDKGQLTEDEKKLKLLNILADPKDSTLFKNNSDFEKQVLNNIKELLKIDRTNKNKFDEEFNLYSKVINYYYSIHNIKMNKDIALLLCINFNYEKLSPHSKILEQEVLKIINNVSIFLYIIHLAWLLRHITIPTRDVGIYTAEGMIAESNTLPLVVGIVDCICVERIIPILEELLRNQNSRKFEEIVTSPKNYYSALQERNGYIPHISSKKNYTGYKNVVSKLIVGAFVLSVGFCAFDYFFMEQTLLQPVKNILPQNNLTNLVVVAVLTILIVYALFQLLQRPPEDKMNEIGISNGKTTLSLLT